MTLTIGVDLGGTKIAGGVVDEKGQVLERSRVATPDSGPEATVEAIAELTWLLREHHDVTAIGIGAAGFVDAGRTTVTFAPNLTSWVEVPLADMVTARTSLPARVENDANAAAWAEFAFGAGADVDDMICVTVGTGIGGGLVLGGELYRGAVGMAAELGHMRVVPDGHWCGCGLKGCWEQYASGRALVREAQHLARTGSPLAAGLLQHAGGSWDDITGPMISAAATAGDETAVDLLETLGRWLGEGMAVVAAALDPAMFVIAGGVAQAGPLLAEPARTAFHKQLTNRTHRRMPDIVLAQLGDDAGIVGAADLARR